MRTPGPDTSQATPTATAKSTRRTAPSRRGGCCATQQPLNLVLNHQSIFGTSVINELKVGFNRPSYDALAFGPAGYDPAQVSLSGTVTSQSIDARGTTGVARSGLLVRATSNASTNGQAYDPRSIALSDALTRDARRAHVQVRRRIPQHRVPVQVPRQHRDHLRRHQRVHRQPADPGGGLARLARLHAGTVLRDRLRAGHVARRPAGSRSSSDSATTSTRWSRRRTARPSRSSSRTTTSAPIPTTSTTPTRTTSRRGCRRSISSTARRRCARATGTSTAPASSRIASSRSRTSSSAAACSRPTSRRRARLPGGSGDLSQPALGPRLHARPARRVQRAYGASVSHELPGAMNLTVGYTGSRGKDMFLRGVANTFDNATRARPSRRSVRSTTRPRAVSTAW